jgi:DNA-binding NarL/FixJ family response regulator
MTRRALRRRALEVVPARLSLVRLHLGRQELAILSFPTAAGEPFAALTPAEREVALALVAGWSNLAVAEARGTSVRTVANQVASLFRKLGVGSRAQLVARFATEVDPPPVSAK